MSKPQPTPDGASASDWSRWAPKARPLFSWAGGKQRFLWENRDRIPEFGGRYHEPFAGGLSVFFHVVSRSATPVSAVVADVNLRVARTYDEVKWEPDRVADQLRQLESAYNAAEDRARFFNDVRAQHNRNFPKSDAARFIFLMSTCFNGVFRVNQSGDFNVPHGAPRKVLRLPTYDEVKAVSVALEKTAVRAQSWESGLNSISVGDFAFFDPPYFHQSDRRDLYEKSRGFGFSDQVRLADALAELRDRGVDFLLTNSAFPEMVTLYQSRGLSVEMIESHRSINARVDARGRVGELIVTPGSGGTRSALRSAQIQLLLNGRGETKGAGEL
jgi:DNA adenine methylase